MYGTHRKHCSLIPPLVSNNNLALLRCGYMCDGTLVHISRHVGRTSNNNNKRCQLCINYIFCHVCFHWALLRISGLWLSLYYSWLHPTLSLVFYSTSLLPLSYYTMSIPCLISLSISLLAPVWLCSWHDFKCMFMIQVYWYMCDYLCTPFGICITTRWGVLTPPDHYVQVSELGACGFSRLLIRVAQWKHGSSVNRLKPHSSKPPARLLSFPSVNSWVPFVLFILIYLLVFSQLRLSVM